MNLNQNILQLQGQMVLENRRVFIKTMIFVFKNRKFLRKTIIVFGEKIGNIPSWILEKVDYKKKCIIVTNE